MRSADRLTKARRSWNMSRIRSKNTSPELRVRSALHKMGFRFRLHVKIPVPPSLFHNSSFRLRTSFVRPDIVLPKYKTAIFVHGCFWHRHQGCKNCTTPTNRRDWWVAKLEGNAARDKLHQLALRKLGWRVLVLWECQAEKVKILQRLLVKFSRPLLRPVQRSRVQSPPAAGARAFDPTSRTNGALRKVRRKSAQLD